MYKLKDFYYNLIDRKLSAATQLIQVSIALKEVKIQIQINQMDLRAKLGAIFAVVGEIVVLALGFSFAQYQSVRVFYFCVLLTSISYIGLIYLSFSWTTNYDKRSYISNFIMLYRFVQFFLGLAWGGVILSGLSIADSSQQGQLLAVLVGLVSTSVFSGVLDITIFFWAPIVITSSLYFLFNLNSINTATLIGLESYYLLTLVALIVISKKMLIKDLNAIKIENYKTEIEVILKQFEADSCDWLWEVDRNLYIVDPSKRFCEVARRDLRRVPITELLIAKERRGIRSKHLVTADELVGRLNSDQPFTNAIVPVFVGGKRRWWSMSGRPILAPSGDIVGYRGVCSDVTELENHRLKLEHLAIKDSLTNAYNRSFFQEAFDKLTVGSGAIEFALLCIDLDYFKAVNDQFGHAVGDRVLYVVSRRIRSCIRSDDYLFRLGGDEFAVLLTSTNRERTSAVAQRIVGRVSEPVMIHDVGLKIGACVGIARVPTDGLTLDLIHSRADLALYRAKSEGRGTYRFFDKEIDEIIGVEQALRLDLRFAIERNEFNLVYQPIVKLSTKEVVTAEALLRWNHPKYGTIFPETFVKILEQDGLILTVGMSIIESAIKIASIIRSPICIAINLSPLQLTDVVLPRKIYKMLSKYHVPANRIDFEVTENSILDSDEKKLTILHQIKALGCRVSLDDFGAGYSSLKLLDVFPFDKLKIDGSFLRGDMLDARRRIILGAIIRLGSDLGLVITAEGVETKPQADLVIELGCREAQGFLFYQPMKEAEFIREFSDLNP